MNRQDLAYYRARLTAELRAAERARHPRAAEAHRGLAAEYADLISATSAERDVAA